MAFKRVNELDIHAPTGEDTERSIIVLGGGPVVRGSVAQIAVLADTAADAATAAVAGKLDRGGDTMTGPLVLAADPVNPLDAATRQFVLANAGGGGGGAVVDYASVNTAGALMEDECAFVTGIKTLLMPANTFVSEWSANAFVFNTAADWRIQLGLQDASQALISDFDPAGSAATAQAFAIQRANHTGEQLIATITGLQAALDALTPKHWLTWTFPGNLEPGNGVTLLPILSNCTITGYRMKGATAPTGTSAIFDVNNNGSTVFTTQADRPTVAVAATTSTTTLPAVVSLSAGDYLSVDVDQAGGTIAGADFTLSLELTEV